jgi:hypothetical protein
MTKRLLIAASLVGVFLTAAFAESAGRALVGRWSTGRISTIQYRDSRTGAPAPTSGTNFAYEFRADGSYTYTGLMQQTFYQCTTSTFSEETGSWTLEGDIVRLRPVKNPYKMTNNCAPSANRESPGKLIGRDYRVRIMRDGAREKLEIEPLDKGAVQAFYRD